jgi:hypothetical protein
MVRYQAETRPTAGAGPLQHLQVTIGIARCEQWPPPDKLVDTGRFVGSISSLSPR